jgi:hypothetical protein
MLPIVKSAIVRHIAKQWPHHAITEHQWTKGPVSELMPELRVLQLAPARQGDSYVYVTVGASDVSCGSSYGLEFFLFSREHAVNHVELLSLVTYMHRDANHHLDVGHTMTIGRPWEDFSRCDRVLVSVPYHPGSEFEWLQIGSDSQVRFLWVIPITKEEQDYGNRNGLAALEDQFERMGIDYLDPMRKSVA